MFEHGLDPRSGKNLIVTLHWITPKRTGKSGREHLRGISSGSFGLTTNPSIDVELTGAVTRTRITTGRMMKSKPQTAAGEPRAIAEWGRRTAVTNKAANVSQLPGR